MAFRDLWISFAIFLSIWHQVQSYIEYSDPEDYNTEFNRRNESNKSNSYQNDEKYNKNSNGSILGPRSDTKYDFLSVSNETLSINQKIFRITDIILNTYTVFVIIFGSIFNILSFCCFYKMKKRNSQNLYLGALSLADFFNIHINLLVPLLHRFLSKNHLELEPNETNNFSPIICKTYGYFVDVALLLPVWIMVVLAAERFMSIMRPLNENIFGTRKKAKKILAILITIILLWCTYKFKTAGIETNSAFQKTGEVMCKDKIENPELVNISTLFWSIVPELITLILNLFIINKIKITTNPHKKFYSSSHCKKITQATRVVILLSIIFIFCISPTGILIILTLFIQLNSIEVFMKLLIARKIVLIFYETNLIINFPIYILTMRNFKETLKNLVPQLKYLERHDSTKIGIKKNYGVKRSLKNSGQDFDECRNAPKCNDANKMMFPLENGKNSKEYPKYEENKKEVINNKNNNQTLFDNNFNECNNCNNSLIKYNYKSSSSSNNSVYGEGCKLKISFNNCPSCSKLSKYSDKTKKVLKSNIPNRPLTYRANGNIKNSMSNNSLNQRVNNLNGFNNGLAKMIYAEEVENERDDSILNEPNLTDTIANFRRINKLEKKLKQSNTFSSRISSITSYKTNKLNNNVTKQSISARNFNQNNYIPLKKAFL